jgi:predicted dithiol-disulfide oxidoreductase (DUF899 family)
MNKIVDTDAWLAARKELLDEDDLPYRQDWVRRHDEY